LKVVASRLLQSRQEKNVPEEYSSTTGSKS
jgi:hypothetical protein